MLAVVSIVPATAGDVFTGLAQVLDDGTLLIDGRRVALYGIDIPLIERTCRASVLPTRCAPRSVLVLDSKVRGFLTCEAIRSGGGGAEAICTVRDDRLTRPDKDLGGQMLIEGWAFAAVDAPAAYRQLERLAEARGAGLWSRGISNVR